MVVYGGYTNEDWKWREPRPPLALFVYKCGLWIHFDQMGHLQGAGMALQGLYKVDFMFLCTNEHVPGSLNFFQLFHCQIVSKHPPGGTPIAKFLSLSKKEHFIS